MEHEGKRYSHILHPKTGYGITKRMSVTVISKDPVVADWLTKSISLLSHRKAKRLARKLNAEFLVVEYKKEELQFRHSPGFQEFMKTFASSEPEH
jgi:thiamine biosynthesis lipoprotein